MYVYYISICKHIYIYIYSPGNRATSTLPFSPEWSVLPVPCVLSACAPGVYISVCVYVYIYIYIYIYTHTYTSLVLYISGLAVINVKLALLSS